MIKTRIMSSVQTTCKELLTSRGYVVDDEDDNQIMGSKNEEDHICIFFAKNSVNVKTVEGFISSMNNDNLKKGIVVYYGKITPYAKNVIESSKDVTIELFSERELRFNITKHSYVPKHELVLPTDEHFSDVVKISSKLPKILQSDPISRFYGFKPKDIIRVTRKDNSISYRTVIGA